MSTNRITASRRSLLAIGLTWTIATWVSPAAIAQDQEWQTDESVGLSLIRPEWQSGLTDQLGVSSLTELTRYDIAQAIDDVTGTFAGILTVVYTNRTGESLDTLPFFLAPNASEEMGALPGEAGSLTIQDVSSLSGPSSTWEQVRPSLVEVQFSEPLLAGQQVILQWHYVGQLRQLPPDSNDIFSQALGSLGSLTGAGESDYGLLASGDGILTCAAAYPTVAPFREGEFDTTPPATLGDIAYNSMATFRVRTVVPLGVTVVTNLVDSEPTPVTGESAMGDSQIIVSEGTLVRDFILVGGRDLTSESTEMNGTVVTSVYRERDAEAGHLALEAAVQALRSFESRFGPYPYTELDVVEATLVGGAGGVEFSTMVLIAGMLYRSPADSDNSLASLLQLLNGLTSMMGGAVEEGSDPLADMADMFTEALEFTVVHEVAHQYFAGIVGNDSRRYPSLDEPLAQYLSGLVFEDRYGAEAAQAAMDRNVLMNYAIYRMLGGADRPVLRDTASFGSLIEYAGLVYGKAPYVYVALRDLLGAEALHDAIRSAVDALRYQIVTPDEWIAALELAAGGPSTGVRETFDRWLNQTHGDEDLGVDDSGQFVLAVMFSPEQAAMLTETFQMLGMSPADLLRMVLGSDLSDSTPFNMGIDPGQALEMLELFEQ